MFCCPSCCIGAAVRLALLDWPVLDTGRVWDSCLQDGGAGHTGEATRILFHVCQITLPQLQVYVVHDQSIVL